MRTTNKNIAASAFLFALCALAVMALPRQVLSQARATILASRLPERAILILGDSRTHRLNLSSLCDRPVFLAGIGGYGLIDLNSFALALAKTSNASAVLINAGVNDAIATRHFEVDQWRNALHDDYTMFKDAGFSVFVLPVIPNAASGQYGGQYLDIDRVAAMNAEIFNLFPSAALDASMRDPETGRLRDAYTDDGIHFNDAGNAAFAAALEDAYCPELTAEG